MGVGSCFTPLEIRVSYEALVYDIDPDPFCTLGDIHGDTSNQINEKGWAGPQMTGPQKRAAG